MIMNESDLDYALVIPSRKRVGNMARINELFPWSIIYIAESEYDDYAKVVPKERIMTHPDSDNFCYILNYLLDNRPEQSIAIFDDDIKYLQSIVGRKGRRIEDPEMLRRVIENGVAMLQDAEKTMFTYAISPKPLDFQPGNPIKLGFALPAGAWIINGRKFRFDERLIVRDDLDFALQVLLEDRYAICDTRFCWVCGEYQNVEGGLQCVRTSEAEKHDKETLYKKWGREILFLDKPQKNGALGVKVFVSRRQ